MNEQERDLILGLTAGALSSAEAAEARAQIDADPSLAQELAIQTEVRDALASLPGISMTAAERSELRSRVRGALNLDAPDQAVPEPARRRVTWLQPLFGLAAAAAVVTAIVVLPGGLGGSDEQDSALVSDTTMAAADVRDGGGQDAPEAETFNEEGSGDPELVGEVQAFTDVDGSDLLAITEGAATPKDINELLDGTVAATRSSVDIAHVEACLEEIGTSLPSGDKTLLGVGERDGAQVAYFAVIDATGVSSVLTIDLSTCSVVAIDD
ncbi:MAG TPA: hypothetical protein VLA29_10500 [Acidimicrobiia bacterium]|nr:hypothetical protein [Acidimicrobiia bacterium]